jgi:hypothetical protein
MFAAHNKPPEHHLGKTALTVLITTAIATTTSALITWGVDALKRQFGEPDKKNTKKDKAETTPQ